MTAADLSLRCPICGTSEIFLVQKSVKGGVPAHMKPQGYVPPRFECNVWRCNNCVFDFLENWQNPQLPAWYQDDTYVYVPNQVGALPKRYDERQRRIDRVRPHLHPSMKVLDIGCGRGDFLKDVRPYVAQVEGLEIAPTHVEGLRGEGWTVYDCLLEDFYPKAQYDVVTLHAVLEHVPCLSEFIYALKRILAPGARVFVEVPNVRDPLNYIYDIPAYRAFFYRHYHLYYFSEISLQKLFEGQGFRAEVWPEMMCSLTNHFHWMHQGKGQATTNDMIAATLPVPFLNQKTPTSVFAGSLLDEVDSLYRKKMEENGIGDMLIGRFSYDHG